MMVTTDPVEKQRRALGLGIDHPRVQRIYGQYALGILTMREAQWALVEVYEHERKVIASMLDES